MVYKVVSGSMKTAQLSVKKTFKTLKRAKEESAFRRDTMGGKWKVIKVSASKRARQHRRRKPRRR